MPSPFPGLTATAADQRTAKTRKATASTVVSHTCSDNEDNEVDEQRPPKKKSTGTITDVAGTVHKLPSASRLAINKELYAATQVTNPRGYKPCDRCSFPGGMRRKKCKDEKNCQFVMIKTTTYKKGLSTKERHDAAVARLKADYDAVVDSVSIYADCKKELPFVDERHLVLTHVFCCTCELNRLCSGHYHAPSRQPRFLSLTACKNCRRSHSLVRRSRPKIRTAGTRPAHQGHLVEARNYKKPETHGAHSEETSQLRLSMWNNLA
jgi:hypothetical protein